MRRYPSFSRTERALTGTRRARISGAGRAWLLRLVCASWRKRYSGLDELDRRLAGGEPLIVVFWHAKYLCLLPLLRDRRACVFTSESRRGDAIRAVLERFGFVACQLPNHGGDESLQLMRDALADGSPGAIAVDGPLGPPHEVHRGAIQLASELGHRLLPASVVSCPKRTVATRWDSLELPYPFSRVSLAIGEPITVPRELGTDSMNIWAGRVASALDAVERIAADRLD